MDDKLFESTMTSINRIYIHNTDRLVTKTVEDDEEGTVQFIYYDDDEGDTFAIAKRYDNFDGAWTLILRDRFDNEIEHIDFEPDSFYNNYFSDMWNILSGEDEKINSIVKELNSKKEEETPECEEEYDEEESDDPSLDKILQEIDQDLDKQEETLKKDPNMPCCKKSCSKQEKEDNSIAVKIREFLDTDDE